MLQSLLVSYKLHDFLGCLQHGSFNLIFKVQFLLIQDFFQFLELPTETLELSLGLDIGLTEFIHLPSEMVNLFCCYVRFVVSRVFRIFCL